MDKNLKKIFGTDHGLDDKSVNFLVRALHQNNLPGFDYIEFKLALDNLSGMGMDEATAYRSAFATASTMGLTKEKLLKTADHYREILQKEKGQFDEALKKQLKKRVEGKLAEAEQLKQKIQEYQEKIRALQKKIEDFQQSVDTTDQQVTEEKEKIQQTSKNFTHTYQSIMNQIEKDISNIGDLL